MGQRPRDGTTLCRQANRRACPGDGHEVSRRPAQRDRGDHCYYSDRLLETIVDIESDRFLNLRYSEDDFKTEAGAILGEYNRNFSNPMALLRETLYGRGVSLSPVQAPDDRSPG